MIVFTLLAELKFKNSDIDHIVVNLLSLVAGSDGRRYFIPLWMTALVVVGLGLITPPVGMNVYVIHGLARDVALGETSRGLAPFIGVEPVRVALLLAIPDLVLWLQRFLS